MKRGREEASREEESSKLQATAIPLSCACDLSAPCLSGSLVCHRRRSLRPTALAVL